MQELYLKVETGLPQPIPPPKRPSEQVNADHIGPFPRTKEGNTHILL